MKAMKEFISNISEEITEEAEVASDIISGFAGSVVASILEDPENLIFNAATVFGENHKEVSACFYTLEPIESFELDILAMHSQQDLEYEFGCDYTRLYMSRPAIVSINDYDDFLEMLNRTGVTTNLESPTVSGWVLAHKIIGEEVEKFFWGTGSIVGDVRKVALEEIQGRLFTNRAANKVSSWAFGVKTSITDPDPDAISDLCEYIPVYMTAVNFQPLPIPED